MTDKTVNTTIEILGKLYPIRCLESEASSLQKAAEFLNQKMLEVQDSGKAINLERIAIITALNIAHQLLESHQQKNSFADKINQHINTLQTKLDSAFNKSMQTELIYTTE